MIHWQPPLMFLSARSTVVSGDVEMLQTDVMRFFAIMCLCLMAIFALVKAIPVASPDTRPAIVQPADLKAEAEALQKQIINLKDKLAALQNQVKSATAQAEQSAVQAATAQKTEKAVQARVIEAQQEFAEVLQSLGETRHAIKEREVKLAEIVKDLGDKLQIREELKTQISRETERLAKLRAVLDRLEEKMDQRPQRDHDSVKKPSEQAPSTENRPKGFSLRFASDAALETLIVGGRVNFFAIAGNKAWQLKLAGGRPLYIETKIPREIYEMETATVPTPYATVFQRQVAAFGRRTVTWGVTLPPATISAISRLIKGRQGGDLVITADGHVNLNGEG